ncbi:MAG: hypothetical protein MUC63_00025 [Planctomycetes bacterium]|jgi:hypothetical protein|nr:hypothetical protein [Planctomycetota bacterium]MCU0725020.1 hypothetical protein [Planctomycetota bacterium]
MKGKVQGLLLAAVLIALVLNIVLQFTGVAKSEVLRGFGPVALFLLLVAANLGFLLAGLVFTVRAWRRREKSTFRWASFGFVAALVFVLGLASSPWWLLFDKDRDRVLIDLTVALVGLGVPYAFFAYSFYREYVRIAGTHPAGHHRHRRAEVPESSPEPVGED